MVAEEARRDTAELRRRYEEQAETIREIGRLLESLRTARPQNERRQ
jgi:hypothetical protein